MAEKLVVIILNSDPQNSAEILEPVYHAGRAGELAIRGVADKTETGRKAGETLYDLIKEAYQSGVVIKASKYVVQRWGDNLIAEVSEVVSGGYIVGEIMNSNNKTLSY